MDSGLLPRLESLFVSPLPRFPGVFSSPPSFVDDLSLKEIEDAGVETPPSSLLLSSRELGDVDLDVSGVA